jgi:SAM-dependent methyltransferase
MCQVDAHCAPAGVGDRVGLTFERPVGRSPLAARRRLGNGFLFGPCERVQPVICPHMSAPRPESIDWYDTPRYYDIIFDADTREQVDFLEQLVQRHGLRGKRRVLEPACGSGRLVSEFARRGWRAHGFDQNLHMLEFAREKLVRRGLSARLDVADMASFRGRARFELAHCLVSTFKYLLDERSARAHLACVAEALVPGGLYVLGLHLSDYAQRGYVRERWVERRGRTQVTCNTQVGPPDRKTRLESVRTRLLVRERGRERRTETNWKFRAYDAAQARRLIAAVPVLQMIAVHDFHHDVERTRALDDGQSDCVLVLRKR